jgi:pimeloyl-ACP methyl ester carboxylesterase
MEFVLTGTVVRYFIVAWRYGAFFLSPLVYVAGMMWLSIAATRFAVIHDGLPYRMLLAPLIWLAIFAGLRWTFGRMVHIGYALDDWYFARDLIHHARPPVHERLDRLARELVRLMRETDADEVIVDGHSLGAPLSLVVIDRALQIDPQLRTGTKPLHIVSTGSSLLKVALHPAAGWLREVVRRVANTPAVYWVEYQALGDIINVYKVDPLVALGLPPTGKPIVKIFRIRLMVEEHTYRRFHFNFLRIHRQAVMGNERRYFYDYYMLCCGPIPLADRVANPEQAVAIFAMDGALNSGESVEVKQGSPPAAGGFDK